MVGPEQAMDDARLAGAVGTEDRDATPLVNNHPVTDEDPFDFSIPDANSQFLVDILNNGKNLNILYECDPVLSPSGDWFKASHYQNTYQISFDYECEYDPPATINEILPSLTLMFPSETGKTYKIEWSTTPDTLPLEKWHEITTFMAEDTVTFWTDSGGDDREPTYHPSDRYYQVWLMNP